MPLQRRSWVGFNLRSLLLVVFCVALAAFAFNLVVQPVDRVVGQTEECPPPANDDPDLPDVCLESVLPDQVQEGTNLRTVVRIDEPLPPNTPESDRLKGGIFVFDSYNDAENDVAGVELSDELIAFVFRANMTTRSMTYRVPGDCVTTSGRVIRIAINWFFDDTYDIAPPLAKTVTVINNAAADDKAIADGKCPPVRNTRAIGEPKISDMSPVVGQELTAELGTVIDPDGLTKAMYTYLWHRMMDDTETRAGDGTSYTVKDTDEGGRLKVEVIFKDDRNHNERLESDMTQPVATGSLPDNPATGAPTISDTTPQVGQTLTVGLGTISDDDGLTNVAYSYQWLRVTNGSETQVGAGTSYTVKDTDEGGRLKVRATFKDDKNNDESLESALTQPVGTESLPDNPATGAPTISDTTPQVGQTLTVGLGTISDEDGLTNATYSYQWLRVTNGIETQVGTGTSYTVVDSDAGGRLKVRAIFQDDNNNDESLESALTQPVAAGSLQATATATSTPRPARRRPSSSSSSSSSFRLVRLVRLVTRRHSRRRLRPPRQPPRRRQSP